MFGGGGISARVLTRMIMILARISAFSVKTQLKCFMQYRFKFEMMCVRNNVSYKPVKSYNCMLLGAVIQHRFDTNVVISADPINTLYEK